MTHTILPTPGFVLRGRDGALVLDSDPTMDIAMKNCFANPMKGTHTAKVIKEVSIHPTGIAQRLSQPRTRDILKTTSGMNPTTPSTRLTPMLRWISQERTSFGTRLEESRAMREASTRHPHRARRAPRRANESVTFVPTRPVIEGVEAQPQVDEPVAFAPTRPVIEGVEARQQDAAELADHEKTPPAQQTSEERLDPTVNESVGQMPDLRPRVEGDQSAFCTASPNHDEGCPANHPHAHRVLAGYTLADAADTGLPSTPDGTLSLRRHRGRGHRIRLLRRRVTSRAECHAETTCRRGGLITDCSNRGWPHDATEEVDVTVTCMT
ncbi:hypothetical protein BC826DRAFT_195619 [Russula brevipes]|nr:hypothetical protein BC826DRAFT_195619 [Russula brevipes]